VRAHKAAMHRHFVGAHRTKDPYAITAPVEVEDDERAYIGYSDTDKYGPLVGYRPERA